MENAVEAEDDVQRQFEQADDYRPLPFKYLLGTFNFVLLVCVICLILGQIQRRHRKKSASFIFHAVCAVWLLFRAAFWILAIVSTGARVLLFFALGQCVCVFFKQ